ncbi:MAG: GDP-mannose 4,6-dehydratase [Chloroflexi bacterium]|nr:GDP-mannose 4,6-dehydratase [Chloroflexota bacterium]
MAGFVGSHLTEHILSQSGIEVWGVDRPLPSTPNLRSVRERITLLAGDLSDRAFVLETMRKVRPDYIIHLAAQAAPSAAWAKAEETLVVNIVCQLHVLAAAVELGIVPRILVIGSGDAYGLVQPEDLPINESCPFRPNNPYAVSKIAQEMLGYQYYLSYHLPVIRMRPFNHVGPRQGTGFVVSSLARQVAAAELGLTEPVIMVGNLEARRDFTDVRDVVRAYWLALERGVAGDVYNLGSGRSRSIRQILEQLLAMSGRSLEVREDPARMRPSDVPDMVCDASKFRRQTGWEPRINWEQTLADTLAYWREELRAAQR